MSLSQIWLNLLNLNVSYIKNAWSSIIHQNQFLNKFVRPAVLKKCQKNNTL
jgi:hypothetical protein